MPASVKQQLDAAFKKKVQDKLPQIVKLIAMETFKRVVERSPVDTGRFRANWQIGVAVRPSGSSEDFDKAAPGSAPSGASTSAALAKLKQLNLGLAKVYVVNNLPYARRLEDGSSEQAPGGMVEITAAEMRIVVNQIAKQVFQ